MLERAVGLLDVSVVGRDVHHGTDRLAALAHGVCLEQLADLVEQHDGGAFGHVWVGVGEEPADIAAAEGSEQRICHGMRQHIGVGVAEQPQGMRDIHPADNELAALDQLMHVVALPYTQGVEFQAHCSCSPFCLR